MAEALSPHLSPRGGPDCRLAWGRAGSHGSMEAPSGPGVQRTSMAEVLSPGVSPRGAPERRRAWGRASSHGSMEDYNSTFSRVFGGDSRDGSPNRVPSERSTSSQAFKARPQMNVISWEAAPSSPRGFGKQLSNPGSRISSPRSSCRDVGGRRRHSPPLARPAASLADGLGKELPRRASPPKAWQRGPGLAEGLAKREDVLRDEMSLDIVRQRCAPKIRTADAPGVDVRRLRSSWDPSPPQSPRAGAPATPVGRLCSSTLGGVLQPVLQDGSIATPPPISPRRPAPSQASLEEACGKPSRTRITDVELGSNAAPGSLGLREEPTVTSFGGSLSGSRRRIGGGPSALSPRGARVAQVALAEEWRYRSREAAVLRVQHSEAMRWRS